MNWRTVTIGALLALLVVGLSWVAAKPYFGPLVGVVIGINIGFVISRLLLRHPASSSARDWTSMEVDRVRDLVKSAYEEGYQAGIASLGPQTASAIDIARDATHAGQSLRY